MDLSQIIGVVGGGIGCVAGILALWDRWRHRRPKLRLSVPIILSGPECPLLLILMRIANDSRAAANLYLETLKAKVRLGRDWYDISLKTTSFTGKPGAGGYLDAESVWRSGIEEIPGFKLHEDARIEYDFPLRRYIALDLNSVRLPGRPDAVKFVIEDCHGRKLTLQSNLPPQLGWPAT